MVLSKKKIEKLVKYVIFQGCNCKRSFRSNIYIHLLYTSNRHENKKDLIYYFVSVIFLN